MLCATFVRVFAAKQFLRSELEPKAYAQQMAFSEHVALDIVTKIGVRNAALQRLALALPVKLLNKPEQLQDWLRERFHLLPDFSHALIVEDLQGKVIAQYPVRAMPFMAARGEMPEQEIGYVDNKPAMSFAVPVADGARRLILRGVTKLEMEKFFDSAARYKNGQEGSVFLRFSQEKLFLKLDDAIIKLQEFPSDATDPVLYQLNQKTHTAEKKRNTQRQEEILSSVPIDGTAWSVIAILPITEIEATIARGANTAYWTFPFVALVGLLFLNFLLHFTLRPFARAARHADRMTRGEIPFEPMPVKRDDEVGELTSSFNRLLAKLDEKSIELNVQKEIAETATVAKSRFLAAASHDLRQPMHALNLYLGALSHFELPPAASPVLANARHCAQTMDDMFRTLLDISKLDAKAYQASFRAFPIDALIHEVSIEFAQQAQEKGLTLRVASCSAQVVSDRDLLANILRNFVSNALRYTAQGTILIGCRRTARGLRIAVYDTGIGIAPEQQGHIFEEFYQAGNRERDRTQGLGLGLAIVQRQAQLIQAPLTLLSQLGRGSVFAVEVKRAITRAPRPTRSAVIEPEPHIAENILQGTLIAVVDDEVRILDATRLLLEQWGCTVIVATCGTDIITHLATSARVPDAIISDYRLRDDETGIDVIALVRSEFNVDIPALLITGDTSPDRINSVANADLKVLYKPIQDYLLKRTLSQMISQNQID